MKQFFLGCLAFNFAMTTLLTATDRTPVWVYTSVYKEYIAPLKEAFEKKYPSIEVMIYQGGSEKIQAKVEAEILAGKLQADIVIMSDPFWAHNIQKRNLAEATDFKKDVNYYSAMVMIANQDFPEKKRPQVFADLQRPEFSGLVQLGSPLESGTMFTTVALLERRLGWKFFDALARNKLASSGGNSTVIQKVESGEKKIGIVLLENALAAKKRGSPIDIIYPADGAVLIPSRALIFKASHHAKEAHQLVSFVLTKEGQEFLVKGYMYSVRKDCSTPEGALPLESISPKQSEWDPSIVAHIAARTREIKKKFSETILD